MLRGLRGAAGALSPLDDELRRRMYLFIRKRGAPVSRDEAAGHVGISRKLAAFHLDKLVDRGLLVAHYARVPGRSGPGAGRSSKLYEPSGLEVDISIPERNYDFVGEILAAAIETESSEPVREVALGIAHQRGRAIGLGARARLRLRSPGVDRTLRAAEGVLSEHGFEPRRELPGTVTLRNCPFHKLARQAPDLICGLNREFVDGILRGLGNDTLEAALVPRSDACCVTLRPREKG